MPETNDPDRGADPIVQQPTLTAPPDLVANAVTLPVDPNRETVAPAPGAAPEIPGYQILAELGRGGMGVVYHAVQTRLGRPVALKMILAGEFAGSADRIRFMTEAEVVARLHHPNIVQLYEFNVHNGIPYFSLEFVDGGTLERRLARQPLPPAEAAALLETLARAVQYAHDHGVVHRDLKPSNILLEPLPRHGSDQAPAGGQSSHKHLHGNSSFGTLSCVVREAAVVPKVTDFGLAKSTAGSTGLTQSGAVMGTPSYMAPEQAEGKGREVGPAADVYALGAILYECLTGRPPFQAATPVYTIYQALYLLGVPPRRLQPNVPRYL
jgi:serine/threonine protein kinase